MIKHAISSVILLATLAAAQTASKPLSIVISPPPLTITTTSLPAGVTGLAYSGALTASGGVQPYTWTITAGALPAGLTLSTTGVISGIPTSPGTANFTVTVKDATAVSHSIDIRWDAPKAASVTTTNIYRNGVKIGMSLVPQNVFTDTTFVAGTTYNYKTTFFDGSESKFSNVVTVTAP